jgi:hypothetical protein
MPRPILITRRQFVLYTGTVAGLRFLPSFAADLAVEASRVLIPYPAKRWAEANHIVGGRAPLPVDKLRGKAPSFDRLPLYNDFCLVTDPIGRWHYMGCYLEGHSKETYRQGRLFHWVAERLQGPYHSIGYVDLGNPKVIRVRTAHDPLNWSKGRTVLGTPPGYIEAESVFVIERNGYYYLWVSGSDYSKMSLYISTDPFNFGDATANRIEEQPGHAAEIVHAEGRYWMACSAVASVPNLNFPGDDLPITQHDLEGVWLQPLEWRAATAETLARVFSKK